MTRRTDLHDCLISPNESDRNGESANVVDGLFALARAISHAGEEIASALRELAQVQREEKNSWRR